MKSLKLMLRMWCVRDPTGRLLMGTLDPTRRGAIWCMFDYMPSEFREQYWKRPEASARAYKRLGYQTIKVKVVPA